MIEKRPDRVSVTFGNKIPTVQYGSFDLRIHYEMDRPEKIKPRDAVRKLEDFVLKETERLIDIVNNKIKGGQK